MLSAGTRWTRTVVYGLTAEIAVIPLFGLTYWALGAKPAQYSTMPFSFLVVFVFAYMAASRTPHPVLQGFLVEDRKPVAAPGPVPVVNTPR